MVDFNILKRTCRSICVLVILLTTTVSAQTSGNFYKFPVFQPGVYKITNQQLQSIGFSSTDQVSIYGYPGMLPQVLDSTALRLTLIPHQIINGQLYCYLEAAHQVTYTESGPVLAYHHYTDTLTYLIGPRSTNNHVSPYQSPTLSALDDNSEWTAYQFFKEAEFNALNSGRNWYSKPIFSGQAKAITFTRPPGANPNSQLLLRLMGQSLSENVFDIVSGNQTLSQIRIAAIPNATYGIKGREENQTIDFQTSQQSANFLIRYNTTDINGAGYLDHALFASYFPEQDLPNGIYFQLGAGALSFGAGKRAWLVSDTFHHYEIQALQLVPKGNKIVVFTPDQTPSVQGFTKANLELRTQDNPTDLLIITSRNLANAANRLARHKRESGIATEVVTLEQIYDAFGYGHADVTAIRNFIAQRYHQGQKLQNVLLFGKGTFDYKSKLGGRPNLVPTYSSRSSLNPLTTYSSDDYFGLLKMGDGAWLESNAGDEDLVIGVGRIPAINIREANIAVNKLIEYESAVAFPNFWKNKMLLFADDGDNNLHLNDAENHAAYVRENHPEVVIDKLYLDKFPQIRSNGQQTSPEAKKALIEAIAKGTLLVNFIGHGNETTLTAERVFTVSDLVNWPETAALPLVVTATCEFGRQDSPLIRSGAEEMLFAEKKGAIGLLTTGRPVFSSLNFALNSAFIREVFVQENGQNADLGSIFKKTKNNSQNGSFNRNFSLIGDPSLKLALPTLKATPQEITDIRLGIAIDTIRAIQEVAIRGSIEDPLTGAQIQANGTYWLSILGPNKSSTTLGDESSPAAYVEEGDVLFSGSGTVQNGAWSSEVILPLALKDALLNGKIRTEAHLSNIREDATGVKMITLGGMPTVASEDRKGPQIEFNYGLKAPFSSPNVPLEILLEDESGINIFNSTPPKDLTLTINNRPALLLNNLFQATENSFRKGKVNFLMTGLEEGVNEITVQAWDNVGNMSSRTETLNVAGSLTTAITQHIAYPNPAPDFVRFKVLHNRLGESLLLHLKIYSTMGTKIYETQRRYVEANFVLDDLEWIFFNDKTNYPAKGIYIYSLELTLEKDGTTDYKSGKIIIQ
jgi:hypothetical protein